jgi:hypothetical protein
MTLRRRMTRFTAVVIAIGSLAGCAAVANGLVRDERTTTRRLQFSGAGPRTLDARTISGSIRVIGDGGSDVRLEAVTSIEADDDAALRTGLQSVVVDAVEQGATVAITVREDRQPSCGERNDEWRRDAAWWDRRRYSASTTLTIRVPRDVRVRLCTINGGEATVTGVTGDFDVSNVNGKIVLRDLRGSGRATTVNGAIEAEFEAVPREQSRFKTVNGDIVATFPRDLAADLQLKTFNGDLFTDFETTAIAAAPQPSRRGNGPRYVYRPRGFTNVRVGAGGPELTFDTLNGDVRILRAAR